jgi:hypothetical protein
LPELPLLRVGISHVLPHARLQEGLPVNKFLEVVAVIEAISLRLAALILLLAALFVFVRHALGL